MAISLFSLGCTPAKEILVYPQSVFYETDNDAINQSLDNRKAIITFLSRERRVASNLFIENDSLKWHEHEVLYGDALRKIKMISYRERSADATIGLLTGIVLGGSIGSAYHANHYENRGAGILVGTSSGLLLGYGVFRLLSESNERIRFVVVHD